MNRTELRVERDFRLVMKPSTDIQIRNIKREHRKEQPGNLGLDIHNIVWMGAVETITETHALNWVGVGSRHISHGLFTQHLSTIGNPTHVVLIKEPALKQVLIEGLLAQREGIYGAGDEVRRRFPDNPMRYYEDWTMDALRGEQHRLGLMREPA